MLVSMPMSIVDREIAKLKTPLPLGEEEIQSILAFKIP